METRNITDTLTGVLDQRLFEIGGTVFNVASFVALLFVLVGTGWLSRVVQRVVEAMLSRSGLMTESAIGAVGSLVSYATLIVGAFVAFQIVGIDIGTLFAAGALFAVGLGLALQSITQNFLAGVVLLAESSIRPGHVLSVEGMVVKVKRQRIRTTIVRTRDGEDLIVPNSMLAQNVVKNYTLFDAHYRVRTLVGVQYGSDMRAVRETLEQVAAGLEWRDREFSPQILMWQFGSSSVNYEVAVWISDPWEARPAISRLNEAIWWAFHERGIRIAFPQLDVHLDAPVLDALRRQAA